MPNLKKSPPTGKPGASKSPLANRTPPTAPKRPPPKRPNTMPPPPTKPPVLKLRSPNPPAPQGAATQTSPQQGSRVVRKPVTVSQAKSVTDRDEEVAGLHQKIAELELRLQIATIGNGDEDEASKAKVQRAEADAQKWRSELLIAEGLNRHNKEHTDKVFAQLKQVHGINEILQTEVDETRPQLQQLRAKIPELESKIKVLGEENLELKAHVKEAEDEIMRLASHANLMELTVAAREQTIEELGEDNLALKKDLLEVKDSFAAHADVEGLRKASKEVMTAKDDLVNVLQTQNNELEAQLAEVVRDSRTIEILLRQSQQEVKFLAEQLDAANEREAQLLLAVGYAEGEHNNLHTGQHIQSSKGHAQLLQSDAQHESASTSTISSSSTKGSSDKIIINVDPANRSNWTWVKKIRAAIPKRVTVEILGPAERVAELDYLMENHSKEVQDLGKKNAQLEKEVQRLKARSLCVEPSHKNLQDEVAAKEAQINLNVMMLRDYGQKLKALEDAARVRAPAARYM